MLEMWFANSHKPEIKRSIVHLIISTSRFSTTYIFFSLFECFNFVPMRYNLFATVKSQDEQGFRKLGCNYANWTMQKYSVCYKYEVFGRQFSSHDRIPSNQ